MCKWYEHFKRKYPTTNRRRFKTFRCKEIEHGELQKKNKSLLRINENGFVKDEVLKLVAFGAHKDESSIIWIIFLISGGKNQGKLQTSL